MEQSRVMQNADFLRELSHVHHNRQAVLITTANRRHIAAISDVVRHLLNHDIPVLSHDRSHFRHQRLVMRHLISTRISTARKKDFINKSFTRSKTIKRLLFSENSHFNPQSERNVIYYKSKITGQMFDRTENMTVYLFLNSNDSTHFHPTNKPDDFIVSLPKPYVSDGCWKCGLLEMNMQLSNDISLSRVHVCCDIIEDSYVRNNMLPILRSQELTPKQSLMQITYVQPFYLSVSKQEIRSIRIFKGNDQLQAIPSKIQRLSCVLCLREKKPWDQ